MNWLFYFDDMDLFFDDIDFDDLDIFFDDLVFQRVSIDPTYLILS